MPGDSLRLRLESLNREVLPESSVVAAKPQVVRSAKPKPALRPGAVPAIPGLVRQGDVVSNHCGEHLLIRLPLEVLWPGGERLVRQRAAHLASTGSEDAFAAGFPGKQLLLDLETCGLSGSALFLVGLLREVEETLTVELLLARDYGEEAAVLTSLWDRVKPDTILATFNGKSFDWPMVTDRTTRHRLFGGKRLPQPVHIDYLHIARRRWRGQFANCKLQTLERHICGRTRTGDIPGSQIPAAYEQFVRTGFEREMDAILLHNAIDLITLLDLGMRLAS
ncbi:ribonuclease H-like domain-containing protein [Adhaeretor mobilis]|uniref:YprB ribonuclease H-like domain-containing protein n=1 Tax=Adhaeretor mobilis TaxID=1930276 RepID=A0A517MR53_9BACT|nr:ribonuclease H-like domain-containing protein [Adhaeretor mobilis]QDS97354.1 hypothetical protein HG15A2_06150 [Adhaeretor mobilis]